MNQIEKPLKKDRVDTAVKKDEVSCFPVVVSASNVETVVLLLATAEQDILIQVLRALSKFAALSINNVSTLYDLNVLQYLWLYIKSEDLGIRRYSLKLLAQVYDVPRSIEILLKDDNDISVLKEILMQNPEDKFIQEFGALIFAKLTKSLEGCSKAIQCTLTALVFPNLTSSDPDVRKNYLQILTNLLKDPIGADIIAESINWAPLYKLLRDQYVDIQKLVLEAIDNLLCRQKDFLLQQSFKNTNGLVALLDVLELYGQKHLHPLILDVLKNYNQTDYTISNFYESGCLTRFIEYLELAPQEEKSRCLAVFLKIAMNKKGREMLHMCNVEQVICTVLAESEISLWGAACQTAILMCRYCRSAGIMVEQDIIRNVLLIIQELSIEWEHVKEDAVLLISELCRVEKRASNALIYLNGHELLRRYLHPELRTDITEIGQENILNCLINIQSFYETRSILLTKDLFQELMEILQNEDLKINKLICEVLYGLMIEAQGKEFFISNKGVLLIRKLLEDNCEGIKEASCQLITISADEITVMEYIKEGVMHLLVENRKMRATCAIWRMALETLLSYHIPAKFAYTKVLNFSEITNQDFYAMKKPPYRFPELGEIFLEHSTMEQHIYFCRFFDESEIGSTITMRVGTSLEMAPSDLRSLGRNSLLMTVLNDRNLTLYLRKIPNIIMDHSLRNNITLDMKDKVKMLGEFVGNQMCGPDPTLICNNHLIDLHQTELRVALRSNILPLGLVRVGGTFERALLFKVLADKLQIPAKLCCGEATYFWIEVSILTGVENQSLVEELMFNWEMLRATHVVDLVHNPGNLLPVSSVEASLYRGENVPLY